MEGCCPPPRPPPHPLGTVDARTLGLLRCPWRREGLTCAALAAGRAAGEDPSRTSSRSTGSRHRAPSTAPHQPACARAPDDAQGTQAPRAMAPADLLWGLRARGLRGPPAREELGEAPRRLGLQPRGGGGGGEAGAATPEGNQLAIPLLAPGPRPADRWPWLGQGPLGGDAGAGVWVGETREDTRLSGRDTRQGLSINRDGQLGASNGLGLSDRRFFPQCNLPTPWTPMETRSGTSAGQPRTRPAGAARAGSPREGRGNGGRDVASESGLRGERRGSRLGVAPGGGIRPGPTESWKRPAEGPHEGCRGRCPGAGAAGSQESPIRLCPSRAGAGPSSEWSWVGGGRRCLRP